MRPCVEWAENHAPASLQIEQDTWTRQHTLGNGGYGVAICYRNGAKEVAVKVMRQDDGGGSGAPVAEITQEVQLLQKFNTIPSVINFIGHQTFNVGTVMLNRLWTSVILSVVTSSHQTPTLTGCGAHAHSREGCR